MSESKLREAARAQLNSLLAYWTGCRECGSWLESDSPSFPGCFHCAPLRTAVRALRTALDAAPEVGERCPTCGVDVVFVEDGRCPNGHAMRPTPPPADDAVARAREAFTVAARAWMDSGFTPTKWILLRTAYDALLASEKGAAS